VCAWSLSPSLCTRKEKQTFIDFEVSNMFVRKEDTARRQQRLNTRSSFTVNLPLLDFVRSLLDIAARDCTISPKAATDTPRSLQHEQNAG
jgi:hypothetical protein